MTRLAVAILLLTVHAGGVRAAERHIARVETSEPAGLGFRDDPAIASNGDGFLVVWLDGRPTKEPFPPSSYQRPVRAILLNAEGERLTARDAQLSEDSVGGFAVASDGRDYLVGDWRRLRDGTDVPRFILMPGDGGAPRELAPFQAHSYSLVFADGHYVVATTDSHGAKLVFLNRSGEVTRTIPLPGSFARAPLMAVTLEGKLFLAWRENVVKGRVKGAITSVAAISDPGFAGFDPPLDLGEGYPVSVAAGANGFALLTGHTTVAQHSTTEDVHATFLDSEGKVLTTSQLAIEIRDAEDSVVVPMGTGYLVAMGNFSARDPLAPAGEVSFADGVALLRVDASGRWIDGPFEAIGTYSASPAAIPTPDGSAVLAYVDFGTVRVQRFSPTGKRMLPGNGVVASMSRASQNHARVARCAGFDAVAWGETTATGVRFHFRRFGPDGAPHGPDVAVANLSWNGWRIRSLTCGRSTAMLTWVQYRLEENLPPLWRGAVFGATGEPDIVTLSENTYGGAMTFDGNHYAGIIPGDRDSSLRRWDEHGVAIETSTLPYGSIVAIGWNGEEYLMVRGGTVRGEDGSSRAGLIAFRADAKLRPIGAEIEIAAVTPDFTVFQDVVVAASPDAWLVGWNFEFAASSPHIWSSRTARIRRDGTLLDPMGGVLTGRPGPTGMTQLSWNGARWELVKANAIVTRGRDGAITETPSSVPDAALQGVAGHGNTRLLVYTRLEPIDGVYELLGDEVDPASWGGEVATRRRSMRH